MKILHVSQLAWPSVGGLEKMVLRIAEEQALNNSVSILTLSHNKKLPPQEEKKGVIIYRLLGFCFLKGRFFLPPKSFCKYVAKTNPDILFTHTRLFPTTLLAGIYFKKKFPNRKWIHVEHGQNFVVHAHFFIRFLARIWDEIFGRWIFSHADKVVVVSSRGENFVRKLGAKNVMVIPTGIIVPSFSPPLPRKNKILFFGRMVKEKGIKEILLAAKENPQWKFELVGEGPLFEYQNLANVIWTPTLEEKKLFQKIQDSDLIVLPSWSESLSLAVLEASSLGRAIIATDVGENAQILSPALIIPPRSPQKLSQKIHSLQNQFEFLAEEGKKNQEKVRKNYPFDTMTEQYNSLLK